MSNKQIGVLFSTAPKIHRTVLAPSLFRMLVIIGIQLMVISAKEFDSQYVQRIGIEGQAVYHNV